MGLLDIQIDSVDYDLKITALRSGMEDVGPKLIRDVTHTMFRELNAITPVRTGKLLNSETEQTFGTTGVIKSNSGYGLYVDEGTRFQKAQKLRLRTMKNSKPQIKEILQRLMLETIGQ